MKIFVSVLTALFALGVVSEKNNGKTVIMCICFCVSMVMLLFLQVQ